MDAPADLAVEHLRALTGRPDAEFRPGQWEAIRTVVEDRRRALVVQRTGWGKSAVYLIATRLLRDAGAGPTVIVSPLLALMRNQLVMTERLGLSAHTVNSTNREEWEAVFDQIRANRLDLLLISPERLSNDIFQRDVRPHLFGQVGLLVIDEVHCISDWGHDFRPDYRRLQEIAAALPRGSPVLGTTATANDRVVADVRAQLGDVDVYRGPLERESLSLHVLDMAHKAERMAWLAENIPRLPGSGIVYCLTIHDAEAVGEWLSSVGISAAVYTGPTPHEERVAVEEALTDGDLKVVVATSALAMGYDNPRIEFVIHYQTPGSPIAYYQQVGRAGRAVDQSFGVLLAGWEDEDVQDWFIETAFPTEAHTTRVLDSLQETPGMRLGELEEVVNLRRSRLDGMLKILEVERAVYREGSRWFRSAERWTYPVERIAAVTAHRRAEQAAMREYVRTDACLMEFLRRQLDDSGAARCGRCANCTGRQLPQQAAPEVVEAALARLRRRQYLIEPRLRLPGPLEVDIDLKTGRLEVGRSLSRWGDPGLAELVRRGKYEDGRFDGQLVEATVAMIREWAPEPHPTWITWVPSTRGELIADFARSVAADLGLPAVDAFRRVRQSHPQKTMENSTQQARNVAGAVEVILVRDGPVFLIDDMVDSRWTLTVLGAQLRSAGSGPVYPVALTDTSNRGQ
jgi:ATP-dependent DNA helicase RecQ